MSNTIAAIATGNVRAAIGIVRISGDEAINIADKVFRAKSGRSLSVTKSGMMVYGGVYDSSGVLYDTCLAVVSRAPKSFTGEDTAELQCHGSPMALNAILRLVLHNGARMAEPGEFTKRAFLNGKLDLTASEAIIDIIDAETSAEAKNAAGQLEGSIAKQTDGVYNSLIDMESHFQAAVDFPDEDVEEFRLKEYTTLLDSSIKQLNNMLSSFERGRLLRSGVDCAIVGRPNVGKSSLLNAIIGYDRAIVTPEPGTTRDTVSESAVLGGVKVNLIDTAGIRSKTSDSIETIGIERAKKALRQAELVLVVTDLTEPDMPEDLEIIELVRQSGKKWLHIQNKSDIAETVGYTSKNSIRLSAKTGDGIDTLSLAIKEMYGNEPESDSIVLTNERQAAEIKRCTDSLVIARDAIENNVTPDAVLTTVEDAISALSALTGRSVREDVVERIFARFCVGK